ncbi:MAG: hypothetical protein IPN69_08490 [Acidobacteria bacterium]|nr:hypothetical protein [Acidobacteriota bacterium]
MARIKRSYDAGGMQIGQDGETVIPAFEDPAPIEVEPVDGPRNKKWLDDMAMMEEFVTIQIDPEENEWAENPVQAPCQGRSVWIMRGIPTIIKRKYLESLLRAKPISMRTKITPATATANPVNSVVRRTGLKYPIHVIEDSNPNGSAWFRQVINEG